MTREIGSKFEHNGRIYEVKEVQVWKCENCAFKLINDLGKTRCNGTLEITGDCISNYREDHRNVYFKEIK